MYIYTPSLRQSSALGQQLVQASAELQCKILCPFVLL